MSTHCTTVCYCTECLNKRPYKNRCPFTSGFDIFITGPSPDATPQIYIASTDSSTIPGFTSLLPRSLSDSVLSEVMFKRRSSDTQRRNVVNAGSGLKRNVESLSNVSVVGQTENDGVKLRRSPAFRSSISYSNFSVIAFVTHLSTIYCSFLLLN